MPWTKDDYPPSMKNLAKPVLDKAIEIGNALVEQGYEEGRAISIAISQAKEWYDNRAQTIGSDITHHLVPKGDRWVIQEEANDNPMVYDTKEEALNALKELSQEKAMKTLIHDSQGKFQKVY